MRAVDTDAEVERMEGASVGDIFRYEGEALPRTGTFGGGARGGFRRGLHRRHGRRPAHVERQYGDAVEGGYDGLSAPFGGADRRAADALRTGETPPNCRGLGDAELVEFMRRNIAEREPYYAQAALVLDCDTLSDEEAVERIIHYLEGNE